jgi:hypothetical protein
LCYKSATSPSRKPLGYGYDIYEIIRYFDITDGSIETDEVDFIDSILADLADNGICNECVDWMNSDDYEIEFEKFYEKMV